MAAESAIDPATVALVSTIIQALIEVVQTSLAQKSAAHQAVLDNLKAAGDALASARADAQAARSEGAAELAALEDKEEPK